MARGGKRSGAGRKKGVPNKVTGSLRERLLASGPSPLEFLVELYRAPEPKMRPKENPIVFATRYKQWASDRVEAGKAAAPFFHPKLQSIEVKNEDGDSAQRHTIKIEFI